MKVSNLPTSFASRTSCPTKNPINNFNIHLMIEKRKSFRSEQGQRKKGSNEPYYLYMSSKKFNKARLSRLAYNEIEKQHILH